MVVGLSAEDLIQINSRVLGARSAPRDLEAVRGVAERPFDTFDGQVLYPSIWEKAASLLHGIAAAQHFVDGNKRTAWLAARLFLRNNAYDLWDVPAVDADIFVRAVAASDADIPLADIAEWFEGAFNRQRSGNPTDPRVEFFALSRGAIAMDDGTLIADALFVAGLMPDEMPFATDIGAAARIHFREADRGRTHSARLLLRQANGPRIIMDSVIEPLSVVIGGHPHHPSGIIPHIVAFHEVAMFDAPGLYRAWLFIDGKVAASSQLRIHPPHGGVQSQPDFR